MKFSALPVGAYFVWDMKFAAAFDVLCKLDSQRYLNVNTSKTHYVLAPDAKVREVVKKERQDESV